MIQARLCLAFSLRIILPMFAAMVLCTPDQTHAQVVKANGAALTLESGDAKDFEDLRPLLEQIHQARVIHLTTTSDVEPELQLRARQRVINFLHQTAGFDVLVLPVGIFEGVWANEQLDAGEPVTKAAGLFYRAWQNSQQFHALMQFVESTKQDEAGLQIIGGLSRFHAAGKERYAPHLIEFFKAVDPDLLPPELEKQIKQSLAGRDRLANKDVQFRVQALAVVNEVLRHFEEVREKLATFHGDEQTELEAQCLRNMRTFIELEQFRANDAAAQPDVTSREKLNNLKWFLKRRFPDKKLIYWEGRGQNSAFPTEFRELVFELKLSVEQ